MFKKKATCKPSTTIRNSDRKSLVAQIKETFPHVFANCTTPEDLKLLVDSILPPHGVEATPFVTTKGHRGTLYTHHQTPLFIQFSSAVLDEDVGNTIKKHNLVPSVQTLWRHPSLVTTVRTGSEVLGHLQTGSDLMVKGMFEYSLDVVAGEAVGVLIGGGDGRSRVVAVGVARRGFARISREEGGKGLVVVSCLGDTITPVSTYSKDDPSPSLTTTSITTKNVTQVGEEVFSEVLEINGVKASTVTNTLERPVHDDKNEDEDVAEGRQASVIVDDGGDEGEKLTEKSTAEVDDTFTQALLYGLYDVHASGKPFPLPMPSSTLIGTYVLPYLPAHDDPDINFKKSSWKKASKFITRQKFLRSKDSKSAGGLVVTGVDWAASEVDTFIPYRLPPPLPSTATHTSATTAAAPGSATKVFAEGDAVKRGGGGGSPAVARHPIRVDVLYKIPQSLSALVINKKEETMKDYHSKEALMRLLETYCIHNNLLSSPTSNDKMVTLDAELYHLLGNKTHQKQLSRAVLCKSFMRQSVLHHRIDEGKVKKGGVPEIPVVMESRQGKKSVTRIVHLERYFEGKEGAIEAIADELKRKCAVSVSIGEVKGTKPGSSVEVTVQGKKAGEAVEVLESWGLEKDWIKVEDKTKK